MNNVQVIFKMLKLVKPLTLPMMCAVLTGVLGFVCAIGIPVLSVMAILQIGGMTPHFSLEYMLLLLVCLAIFRGILHYIEQACNHYIAFKLLAIIRDHVYTALRRLAPAKLDGKDKGNLISLITNDIELLEVFYAHTISPTMIAVGMYFLLIAVFLHIHLYAAIIATVAYCFMAIVIPCFVQMKGKRIGQENRDEIGALSSYILESFRGVSTLLQYQAGYQRSQQTIDKSHHIEDLQKQMKSIESIQIIMSQCVIMISGCMMFLCLFTLYQHHQIAVYHVIMATVLMISSFGPFIALSSLSQHLLSTLSSARRVIGILEEKELIAEVKDKPQSSFGHIQFHHVSFAYEDEMILEDISETFEQGKITCIVGKSGSGKSTLLKLLMRFYDVSQGMITINGKNIKDINTKDMRSMFAYVTQETVLFHDSIYNNLKLARLDATDEEIYEACQKASIHDLIMSLPQKYHTPVAELGSSLSGGEKQRIGLARAFLSQAPCILLDEPTSNLDVLNEAVILESLKQTNQTIILVSHRESTIQIADSIIYMKEGRMS